MFDMNISVQQLDEINTARIEQYRRQVALEQQIPHVPWRHRIASTLLAWARRLEPEIGLSRPRTA